MAIGFEFEFTTVVLVVMRLVVFGLALGITVTSFRAYNRAGTDRLESAFIGFAFISMGVALTTLGAHIESWELAFRIVETIPFMIGFSMLYFAMYR